MRVQFSIRDFLLSIAILALAAGWWIDHQRINKLAVQQWEYKLQEGGADSDLTTLLGNHGWEMCGVIPPGSYSHAPIFYFKRPK